MKSRARWSRLAFRRSRRLDRGWSIRAVPPRRSRAGDRSRRPPRRRARRRRPAIAGRRRAGRRGAARRASAARARRYGACDGRARRNGRIPFAFAAGAVSSIGFSNTVRRERSGAQRPAGWPRAPFVALLTRAGGAVRRSTGLCDPGGRGDRLADRIAIARGGPRTVGSSRRSPARTRDRRAADRAASQIDDQRVDRRRSVPRMARSSRRSLVVEPVDRVPTDRRPQAFRWRRSRQSAASKSRGASNSSASASPIDDFSAASATLPALRRLGVDLVRIDSTLTQNLARSSADRLYLKDVAESARRLGMATLANGAGESETLRQLRQLGIDFAQVAGFDWPPAPATDERNVTASAPPPRLRALADAISPYSPGYPAASAFR